VQLNEPQILVFAYRNFAFNRNISHFGSGRFTNNNPGSGTPSSFSIDEVLVPSATSVPYDIGDDTDHDNSAKYSYYMGKYDVTYLLWSTVVAWATDDARGANKYTYLGAGAMGRYYTAGYKSYTSGRETDPVTCLNWYDAIVWCNALTEYYNAHNPNKTSLVCVYKDGGSHIIRDSSLDGPIIDTCKSWNDFDHSATGFRLPTYDE